MLTDEQIRDLTNLELRDLLFRLGTEDQRRVRILREEELLNQTQIAVQEEQGVVREGGEEWTQPTGVHDAYLLGATVVHDGKTWESLTPYNVWEPGQSGWREVTSGGEVPEFVPPTGAHDAYMVGDLVTFEGSVYRCVIDGTIHSPAEYPGAWEPVGSDD